MHHHAYLWTGTKDRFDQEALRRPELTARYREVAGAFPTSDLPPLETAYWLVKPRSLIQGTWDEAKDAAAWLGKRLTAYAPRFASGAQRDAGRLATHVTAAAERLAAGGDVSLGFYLERPAFLSLALVTCSPNRERPGLTCPLRA